MSILKAAVVASVGRWNELAEATVALSSKARSTKQARAAGMTVEVTIWQWLLPHAVRCRNTCLISSNYACMTEISGWAERLPKEMLYQALLDSGLIGWISDCRGKKGLRERPRDR